MKWEGKRSSTNVTDARGKTGARGIGIGAILNIVGRIFGFRGILVLLGVGLVGWQLGFIDPVALMSGEGQVREVEYQPSPEEQRLYEFVTVVLGLTEDVWSKEFKRLAPSSK